ncbi:MAG: hypothetical protein LIO95_04505 [Clostridiales bacterium]|nr:hypothetical protein [Clostridiales bacterium]
MGFLFDLEMFFDDLGNTVSEKIGEIQEDVHLQIKEIPNKLAVIRSDVEIEGGKRGCEKAAQEFEETYKEIEDEYQQTLELFKAKDEAFDIQADALQEKLEELEKTKEKLEQRVNQQIKDVTKEASKGIVANGSVFLPVLGKTLDLSSIVEESESSSKTQETLDTADIPDGEPFNTTTTGTLGKIDPVLIILMLILHGDKYSGIISLLFNQLYRAQARKMDQAAQRKYQDMKKTNEAKIDELKKKLNKLKAEGNAECQELMGIICEMLDEISTTKMQIAELKYLCEVKS